MAGKNKVFNILHVMTKMPVGGVENMLVKVVRGYNKERFNVRVCCIKEGGEAADLLIKEGCQVDILNRMQGHGFDWGAVSAIYKTIKKQDVHILRTHQYHANLYGRIAGVLARVPVIIPSFHNLYVSPDKPKFHRRTINYILSFFSDALVTVSEVIALDVRRYDRVCPDKIRVVHNGIELETFTDTLSKEESRDILKLPRENILIGNVGRLTDQKGHEYLIKAASGMSNVTIAIAGDGPLKNDLKELAAKVRCNCIFLGRLKPEEVPIFLKALDIFCFPSLWEGMPSALAEAMAAGLPVIASDIAPNREVLGDAGILVTSEDEDALTKEISKLLEDANLRTELSAKSKMRANNFSIEKTVHAYEDLFEELIRRKKLEHEI